MRVVGGCRARPLGTGLRRYDGGSGEGVLVGDDGKVVGPGSGARMTRA